MTSALRPLPASYGETRAALQAVAEHLLSPYRYRATGRIGLCASEGGFGTPPVDGRQVRVDGRELADGERRAGITTLRAGGEFLGIEPGAPVDVYAPTTPLDLDAPLRVDDAAARVLGDWFAFSNELLEQLRGDATPDDDPGDVQLWPEHFDIAMSLGPEGARANYGGSPGDGEHAEPYLYIGPWSMEGRSGEFWNERSYASLSYSQVREGTDALEFLRRGKELMTR